MLSQVAKYTGTREVALQIFSTKNPRLTRACFKRSEKKFKKFKGGKGVMVTNGYFDSKKDTCVVRGKDEWNWYNKEIIQSS